MTNKKIAIPVSLSLFIGVLAWWQVSGTSALGQMELQARGGPVQIVRDGKTLQVDGTMSLQPFDVIKTSKDASAELRLAGARNISLAELSEARVVDGRTIENLDGGLLARTSDPLNVMFDDVVALADRALFRVDQGFGSARAATYAGSVQLDAPGQTRLTVRRLFEAHISAGDLPGRARPYRVDRSDPWDPNILAYVFDLDEVLTDWGNGLEQQLGSSRPDSTYFSALADRPAGFVRPYLSRPTTDLLIGFSVADLASQPLEPAFRQTFRYRDDGGSWGVVASIMGAKQEPLKLALERVTAGTGAVAGGTGAEPAFTLAAAETASSSGGDPSGGGGDDTSTGSGTGTGGGGDDGDGTGGDGTDDDGNGEEPPACTTTELECASQELQETLPGTDPDPSPSPSPKGGQQSGGDDLDPLFGNL